MNMLRKQIRDQFSPVHVRERLWRPPSQEPIARLRVLAGCVCLGGLTAFFLVTQEPGWYLLLPVAMGLGAIAMGIADLLPESRRGLAGVLRIVTLIYAIVVTVGLIALYLVYG